VDAAGTSVPTTAAGSPPPVATAPTAVASPARRPAVRRVRVGCARHARGRVACRVPAPNRTAVRDVLLHGGYAYAGARAASP
jgi:hypothetical protein